VPFSYQLPILPLSHASQAPICFLSLWICLLRMFKGITWFVPICVWLLSLATRAVYQYFIPFYDQVMFHALYSPQSIG
jgi:hypothetical protein